MRIHHHVYNGLTDKKRDRGYDIPGFVTPGIY